MNNPYLTEQQAPPTQGQCRERFEKWAASRHMPIRRDGDSYFNGAMKAKWITWQAAYLDLWDLLEVGK